MSDQIRIDIRFRNHRLVTAMEEKFGSVIKFCKATGMNAGSVYDMVNLKRTPTVDDWWTDEAIRISDALMTPPDELWPDALATMALEKNTATKTAGHDQITALLESPDPFDVARIEQMKQVVGDVMEWALRPRELEVIRKRFGFYEGAKTLKDIAHEMDLSVERIRQIEQKALRKLRHPARAEKYQDMLEA